MSEFNQCLRNGVVSFGDDFDTIEEVTRLFNGSRNQYRPWFSIPGCENTICWLPSGDGMKGWHNKATFGAECDGRGWHEIVSIDEFNDDKIRNSEHIQKTVSKKIKRLVFWRESRENVGWYKFYGTFEVDTQATLATLETDQPRAIYHRISKTANCLKVEDAKRSFTDEEFANLNGRKVRVCLLNEVEYFENSDEDSVGTVKVWPGEEFTVVGISSGLKNLHCVSSDNNGRKYSVPRRDFELGYVALA